MCAYNCPTVSRSGQRGLRENREREEQPVLLREEEERVGAED